MAERKSRSRWIAAILIALALLALFAWRTDIGLPRGVASQRVQASHAPATSAAEPRFQADDSGSRIRTQRSADPNEDDPEAQACSRDFHRSLQSYHAQLGTAKSADEALDLLLLDMMSTMWAGPSSVFPDETYQAVAHLWPGDAELAWLSFNHCVEPGCNREAELRRLLAADPNNTAAWMTAMVIAREHGDEKRWAIALRHASESKFYDSRSGVVFLHTRRLLQQVPPPDSCRSPMARLAAVFGRPYDDGERMDIMAQGLESAVSLPFFPALGLCRYPASALTEAQRNQCLVVLARVVQGDTLMEQSLALRGLLELESDPARLRHWREQYRQIKLLVAQTGNLEADGLPPHFITLKWSQGEFATYKGLAMERGLWPPPPDWLPDDPKSRALITGEPLP